MQVNLTQNRSEFLKQMDEMRDTFKEALLTEISEETFIEKMAAEKIKLSALITEMRNDGLRLTEEQFYRNMLEALSAASDDTESIVVSMGMILNGFKEGDLISEL